MYRRPLLLFCLSVVFSATFAQNYSRTIDWPVDSVARANLKAGGYEGALEKSFLWFKDYVHYPNIGTMLPHYADIIPIPNIIHSINQLNVQVTNRRSISLNSDEERVLRGLSAEEIKTQKAQYDVFKSRGQTYLQFHIPTISTNPSTGRVEKLVSFNIEVTEQQVIAPKKAQAVEATQSVLSSGIWKLVRVERTGVHRISYSDLLGMGLSNLENVSIWGHDGRQLPYWNNQPSPDDLIQIPIQVDKGTDGIFNQGDYIYFYAQGPVTWSYNSEADFFEHRIHDFATSTHYFITTSRPNPLRITTQSQPAASPSQISNTFDALVNFERNDTNLIRSGRQWFGESFDVYTTRNYNTGFNNPVAGGEAKVKVKAAARSSVSSSYTLKANGTSQGNISVASVNTSSQYTNFAAVGERLFNVNYSQGELQLELTYNKPSPAAKGWLDYIIVNARQRLRMGPSQLLFRDKQSVSPNAITEFNIENTQQGLRIWDVTDFFNPVNLEFSTQGTVAKFKSETSSLKEFIAFTPSQANSVNVVGDVPNQNIHGEAQPELVIVTHPNFLSQAQELAQLHQDASGLKTLIVTNQQVYNEFSSGNPDVSAIRNMMRMFYRRAISENDMPKYLLLFGDGSYDNRPGNSSKLSFVLTYQSENSLHVTSSFVSDDFFGLLDDNEGEATGLLDLGIGRIPSATSAEASIAVNKIRQYMNPTSKGAWNNQLCFIADDGDGNLHMRDADLHAQYVEENHPHYNIDKIYFDAYPLVSLSVGDRYPAVTEAINNRANQGALIMNYVGHANAMWLAHEMVLKIDDIQSWRNLDKLSLFVTATCEYSRFDDLGNKSAGEHILFAPRGGSVALVSTSRVVYANPNFTLNRNFIHYVFAKREGVPPGDPNEYYRLGDVLRLTKVATGGQINKRNFLLLGDPALHLHYPTASMALTEINGLSITSELDTLKALSRVQIKGAVVSNEKKQNFSGEAEFTLFDKAKTVTTLSNTGGTPFTFTTRENSIYRGRSSITDGQFDAKFIIPKDIMYSYGQGRFSLFASSGQATAVGHFEDFIVGGISTDAGNDSQGPEIEIYMNNTKFVNGGITDPNPKLIVHLLDSSGINTTGAGIGHDLTATLIGSQEITYTLNDYYVAELDNFQKGKAEYQLSGLAPGNYTVKVKAWDVYNNSSESEITFSVKEDSDLKIDRLLNYPNPFTESTGFYFEHNQPFENFDILIQIFSPSGKLVKTIDYFHAGDGSYRIGPIAWNGLDDFGDRIGRGVYFYRLKVRLGNGQSKQVYQKLVILK